MLEKTESYIARNRLFLPGDTLVVAVSGGADSVALLDILSRLEAYRLKLVVAHLNHGLRGEESDADEDFVRTLAEAHDCPSFFRSVDVKKFSREQGLSLEEGGRVCRYAFFDEVAAECGATATALAHHADDQAETVLMRLLRGSAGTGLRGILPSSAGGRYVRPLLQSTRKEIEEYLSAQGLSYRTDSSNSDTDFLRNRIRHELLPHLAGYNPAIVERLTATAEALAADEELLDEMAEQLFFRYATFAEGRVGLSAEGVASEPKGGRLRLYRSAIRKVKGDLRRISYRHFCDIDRLVNDPKPHMTLDLPDRTVVAKSYDSVTFACNPETAAGVGYEIVIDGPGVFTLPNGSLLCVEMGSASGGSAIEGRLCARFDLAVAPFPWKVRTFRNGDRIQPYGMKGSKKVKDLFIEKKIPQEERRRIPLLFCGDKLLWVCGIRSSEIASVTESTETIAAVSIREGESLNSL